MSAGTGGIGGLPPVGAGVCQPDEADCAISHATTGWCLQASGNPVIVVTRWACEPNDATPTVTMLDPATGDVVPNQVVVPCDGRDFEINHLCDFDPDTGEVIAAVTQIFEWNEATGSLDVRLVRADDPTGPPYVVQGVLRQCHVPTWVDVEPAVVCGDTAGVRRQLIELVVYDTRNGLVIGHVYLDGEGNQVAPNPGEVFTVGDCWTPTLPAILDELEEANGHLADLNAEGNTQTAILTQIRDNADQVEPLLTALGTNTDGLEGLLTQIRDNADQVEPLLTALGANTDGIEPLLTSIRDNADTVEPLLTAANVILTAIRDNADQVEPLLTAIGSNTDGIEPLLTTANGFLTTLAGAVKAEDAVAADGDLGIPALGRRNDGAANRTSADGDYTHLATDAAGRIGITLLGATLAVNDAANAAANTTMNGHLANIAGYTDGIEGLLTAIQGRLSLTALLPPGQVGVGVAAVQMHPAGQALQQGVIVQAHPNNAGIVFVGNSNAVTVGNGFPLAPGASVTLPVPNTNQVWLIASQAAQTAAWIGV